MSALLKATDYATGIKHWYVLVVVGYLGWMTNSDKHIALWPLALAICGFWMMDGLILATQRFRREFTLAQVERLFSRRTLDGVRQSIEEYRFLTDTKDCAGKEWWSIGGKVHRLLGGLINGQAFFFYVLPLMLLVWYDPQLHRWASDAAHFACVRLVESYGWAYVAARLAVLGLLAWYLCHLRAANRHSIQQKWDENYWWKEEKKRRCTLLFAFRRFITIQKSVAVGRCRAAWHRVAVRIAGWKSAAVWKLRRTY